MLVRKIVENLDYKKSESSQVLFLSNLLNECVGLKFEIPDDLYSDIDFIGFFSWISWSNTEIFLEITELSRLDLFLSAVKSFDHLRPRILAISEVEYPRGGGEANLKEWLDFANYFGFQCFFLSFMDRFNKQHKKQSIEKLETFTKVNTFQNVDTKTIGYFLELIEPDFVITQGGINLICTDIAEIFQIPVISVYNYWDGLINLGSTQNFSMLENIGNHSLSEYSKPHPLVSRILVSEFMLSIYQLLGGKEELVVIEPFLYPIKKFSASEYGSRSGILAINLHPAKSGEVFWKLSANLSDRIPLIGIDNEPDLGNYASAQKSKGSKGLISGNTQVYPYRNLSELYQQVKIVIVPSKVDETFCRVALEAVLNGATVLSTKNGNLPNVLGPESIYLSSDPIDWLLKIEEIYDNSSLLESTAQKQFEFVESKYGWNGQKVLETLLNTLDLSKKKDVAIFTSWTEQGLGIQSKMYSKNLMQLGIRVHIFAFKPYANIKSNYHPDTNAADWAPGSNCTSLFYSEFERENVPAQDLVDFIKEKSVSRLIVPEVCWKPNWERLEMVKTTSKIKLYIVPNSETIRSDELLRHRIADGILAPTQLMFELSNDLELGNTHYIGNAKNANLYSSSSVFETHFQIKPNTIKYVHIAGHNPETRKQTRKVLQAFIGALEIRDDIYLLITTTKPLSIFDDLNLPRNIKILSGNFPDQFIESIYSDADISIQVSSHEGIGLGFYESIACNTPVISINCAPHNEIVIPNLTGWLIDCFPFPLPDNAYGVVSAWDFNPEDLTKLISQINQIDTKTIAKKLQSFQSEINDEKFFRYRLISALYSPKIIKIQIFPVLKDIIFGGLLFPLYLILFIMIKLYLTFRSYSSRAGYLHVKRQNSNRQYQLRIIIKKIYAASSKGSWKSIRSYVAVLLNSIRKRGMRID